MRPVSSLVASLGLSSWSGPAAPCQWIPIEQCVEVSFILHLNSSASSLAVFSKSAM